MQLVHEATFWEILKERVYVITVTGEQKQEKCPAISRGEEDNG